MADNHEITIQQTKAGWHWAISILPADGGTPKVIADSFEPSPTAVIAAAEASAEIHEPGRALRRYRDRRAA